MKSIVIQRDTSLQNPPKLCNNSPKAPEPSSMGASTNEALCGPNVKLCNSPEVPRPFSKGVLTKETLSEFHFNNSCSSVNMGSSRSVTESSGSPSAPSETASQSEDQNDAQSPQSLLDIQKKILSRSMSRCGRDQQRVVADPETGVLFRLTTGAVPIMPDGKIVLVSSSRAEGWILPKGGWEMDESIEVGAHRETFEEAGVFGALGPRLTDVEYETRKGKKRRLELESLAKLKHGMILRSGSSFESSRSSSFMSVDEAGNSTNDIEPVSKSMDKASKGDYNVHSSHSSNTTPDLASAQVESSSSPDLSSADNAGRKSCTHVRMCMFIMYVSEVREEWPESGRARKIVDIDAAIETMSQRPEFQTILLEVKRNRYHLNIPSQDAVKSE